MKVLMLGWEYPPQISGGLATACEGLTHALAAQGVTIDFVLPRRCGREDAAHMSLLACNELRVTPSSASAHPPAAAAPAPDSPIEPARLATLAQALYFSSYARPSSSDGAKLTTSAAPGLARTSALPAEWLARDPSELVRDLVSPATDEIPGVSGFFSDPLFREVARYTREVARTSRERKFDLIHAHDWMTFPAGVLLARERGVPLVCHIHSLEYDRCGDGGGNIMIRAIEELGARCADRVIAVSHYTRRLIADKLGVDPARISVAHNGVRQAGDGISGDVASDGASKDFAHDRAPEGSANRDDREPGPAIEPKPASSDDARKPVAPAAFRPQATRPKERQKKRVLFLGRVTYQKGPDYFVEAAALVLKHESDVTFVVAGTGDMLPYVKERVRALKLQENFEFPGFVSGAALDLEFRRADLYVMPSVSEPFGIAPLEALARGTPALISKQSGVSEVLSHALKSDFWDVRKMADFILAALTHPELGQSMMAMSRGEIQRLRWERAADDVAAAYRTVLPSSPTLAEAV